MSEPSQTDRSEEIKDAARQYAFNRLRPQWPVIVHMLLYLPGIGLILYSNSIERSGLPHSSTWQSFLLLSGLICLLVSMWLKHRWYKNIRDESTQRQLIGMQEGDALIKDSNHHTFDMWWFWPIAFLVLSGFIFGLIWLWLRFSIRFQLASTTTGYLIASMSIAVGSLWSMRIWLRGDPLRFMREQNLRAQEEAGVVVDEPLPMSPKLKGWFLPFACIILPLFVLSTLAISHDSPLRFQPLILASGFTLLGFVRWLVRSIMGMRAKSGWRPVHFLAWALYCCYALAVAIGLPQPFANTTKPWRAFSWNARIITPLFLIAIIDLVARALYSRRQLRRLQNLLAEVPGKSAHDAGD